MATKTMAEKVLSGRGIDFEVFAYPDTLTDAVAVAEAVGASPSLVFKTLVATRPAGKPMLVMIPANRTLNLKSLAKMVGEKKIKMASHNEAEDLTKLQVGGISALVLLNRGFDIFLDKSAISLERIYISGGKRGLQVRLSVKDLEKVTKAKIVEVSE